MPLQLILALAGIVGLALVLALIFSRRRLGALNAASWLVIWGAIILMTEHPLFAIAFSAPIPSIADELQQTPMSLLPHARTHFFMAGIYTLIGLSLLCLIARTLLREGRRAGWYSVLFALLVGGLSELFIGAQWFQHGSPLYRLSGVQPIGFGWQFLYVYFAAWLAALVISYKPIFATESISRPIGTIFPTDRESV